MRVKNEIIVKYVKSNIYITCLNYNLLRKHVSTWY